MKYSLLELFQQATEMDPIALDSLISDEIILVQELVKEGKMLKFISKDVKQQACYYWNKDYPTRCYIPKGEGTTSEYAIRLDKSLTSKTHIFYHEKISKENQVISATLDNKSGSIQLGFNPKKLLQFAILLNQVKDLEELKA